MHRELSRATQSVQYIENYTMWPTAKIKTNAKVIPPIYNKVDENTLQPQTSIIDITQ